MNWLKRNVSDLMFLVGVSLINVPPYTYDYRLGLLITGASLITLSIIRKGGD